MNKNKRYRGFSLVELMVALVIGSFLIIGAVTVYVQSRNTYSVNEAVARLQENARYALSTLEPDVRLANFWGLMNDPQIVVGAAGNVPLATGTQNNCGPQFDIDLRVSIEGRNNTYGLTCTAGSSGTGTPDPNFSRTPDTIIVRHASEQTVPATPNTLQIYSTRQGGGSRIVDDGTFPGAASALVDTLPFGPQAEIRDLDVRAYYVFAASSLNGVPSLRRKRLQAGGAAPAFNDEEIMPGVEDLQIQFGIDLGADRNGDGVIDDADNNGIPDHYDGIATRYVDPDDPALATAQVVAVRLWLLVRADTPEVGFVHTRPFIYADVNYLPNDSFRRLLVSRTIQIRNTVNLQT